MINILLLALICFVIGNWVPVILSLKSTIFTQITCGIGIIIWSIGCFAGGMMSTVQHFDLIKIERIDDREDWFTIKLMLGHAVIYKRVVPVRGKEE